MTPSKHQLAVFDAVRSTMRNLLIKAVAGSGKSTTLKMISEMFMPEFQFGDPDIVAMAFNNHIVKDLTPKMPLNTKVTTFHSMGYQAWKDYMGVKVTLDKFTKTSNILQALHDMGDKDSKNRFYKWKFVVGRLISLFKAHGPSVVPLIPDVNLVRKVGEEMVEFYDLKLPKMFPAEYDVFWRRLQETWIGVMKQKTVIDFDDMIAMPVYYNAPLPQYRLGLIDEFQDMNPVQIDFVFQLGCRIIAVGDERQAIYGFRGADVEALKTFSRRANAIELPLSICYRCPKSVVAEAKRYAPEIEPWEEKEEGINERVKVDEYRKGLLDGDYVLCRCTAPLVTECMKMIRDGRKASVKGRDIGEGLISTIESIDGERDIGVEDFLEKLRSYHQEKLTKLERAGKDSQIIALNDTVETLMVIAEDCATSGEMTRRIKSIFADEDSAGVTFCTVHRSKGLEADNIYIIEPTLMPHPAATKPHQRIQETNIIYVAVTRALKALRWVDGAVRKDRKKAKEINFDGKDNTAFEEKVNEIPAEEWTLELQKPSDMGKSETINTDILAQMTGENLPVEDSEWDEYKP